MQNMTNTIGKYPFSEDIVMPVVSAKERTAKQRTILLRTISEKMLYWVLPWLIIGLMTIARFQITGLSAFVVSLAIIASSGIATKAISRNRHFLYFFGISSYLIVIVLALFATI